ncbi:MAG: hypothetical protein HY943_21005 [Gammaproteobacteria bacterium]|nr:hypothetical protein [Gammaproteobacteria bacterium]
MHEKLVDARGMFHARQEDLMTQIRKERLHLGNSANEGDESRPSAGRLGYLLEQSAMIERVEFAATHLERQVSRRLGDSGSSSMPRSRLARRVRPTRRDLLVSLPPCNHAEAHCGFRWRD